MPSEKVNGKEGVKKKINVTVSLFEAALIKSIRQYEYGTFTIHKLNGEPRRIEILWSEVLNPDDSEGLNFESTDTENG